MKSYLSISHLIRHFMLFGLTVLFLLSIARAGYSLWQIQKFEDTQTLLQTLSQGARFDVAAIGLLMALPVFIIPLLSMFKVTLGLGRFLSMLWFVLALLFVLLLELITPYFIETGGIRPDLGVLQAIKNPTELFSQLWSGYMLPAIIGIVLVILILMAYWNRIESTRFLRYPVRKLPALLCSIIGLALCVLAVRSNIDLEKPALDVSAALISTESVVNEITLSTPFKMLTSWYADIPAVQSLLKADKS